MHIELMRLISNCQDCFLGCLALILISFQATCFFLSSVSQTSKHPKHSMCPTQRTLELTPGQCVTDMAGNTVLLTSITRKKTFPKSFLIASFLCTPDEHLKKPASRAECISVNRVRSTNYKNLLAAPSVHWKVHVPAAQHWQRHTAPFILVSRQPNKQELTALSSY